MTAPCGLFSALAAPFAPPKWLQGGHRQSMLASMPPRRWRLERAAAAWLHQAHTEILSLPDEVRLLAEWDQPTKEYNNHRRAEDPSIRQESAPLALLLHGWEGSSRSVHMLSLTTVLREVGIETMRLNLRDHGNSHHLNAELFHSCRLAEVVDAVRVVRERYPKRSLVLVGFSLGGNFALRVACTPGLELSAVIAICPPLDPAHSLMRLQHGSPIYRHYFLQKWNRSLAIKRRDWPALYDQHSLPAGDDLLAMTDILVRRYTDYSSVDAYFAGYAILGDRLDGLTAPAAIVLAQDDPIIPVSDRAKLTQNPLCEVFVQSFGGHCGFLEHLEGPAWTDFGVRDAIQKLSA